MILLRLLIISFLALIASGCASTYKQSQHANASSITVLNPRIIEGEKYRPFIAININGKRVTRTDEDFEKDPQTSFVKALIDPGSHQVKIEVTAYKGARAKYGHKIYVLELNPDQEYQLSADIPEEVSATFKGDSWAYLILINVETGKKLISEKIVLNDNGFRSVVEDPTIVVPIIL